MTIYNIMIWFQWCCMLLSFIFSIRTINNNSIPSYMRGFYIYSLLALCLCSLSVINLLTGHINFHYLVIIQKLSLIFHYSFLSYFIYGTFTNRKVKLFFTPIFFSFLCLILISLVDNLYEIDTFHTNAITNLALVFYCLIYYYQLFNKPPVEILLEEPSFWMVSGLFLSLTITVPINSLRHFLINHISEDFNFEIVSISVFAYGTMHLFFVKAYLCSIHKKIVS